MITPLYANAPLILPPWQVAAITAQGITVRYPDDLTPVRMRQLRPTKPGIPTASGGLNSPPAAALESYAMAAFITP